MPYSEEEFKKLLEELANDLLNANHHFRLYRNIRKSISKYTKEINQCKAFWTLTLDAHREVSFLHLCRAYDNNQKSLSLIQLLQIIQGNTDLFDLARFRNRLKDNPYVDSLAKSQRVPTEEQLKKDMQFVSNSNPMVKKLTILRGNLVAHKNIKQILSKKDDSDPLTWGEFEELIVKGLKIYNSYRLLFEAGAYSSQLIGEDDYQIVLEYIRIGLKAIEFRNEIE